MFDRALGCVLAMILAASVAGLQTTAEQTPDVWLGVLLSDAVDGGVEVVAVIPGGPASHAGVRPGDLILKLRGEPVAGRAEVGRLLVGVQPGTPVAVEVLRGGRTERMEVVVTRRDASVGRTTVLRQAVRPGRAGLFSLLGDISTSAIPSDLRQHFRAPSDVGVLVTRVRKDGAIWSSGLRVGDVLVEFAGAPIRAPEDLVTRLEASMPGEVRLRIVRDGTTATLRCVLPGPESAAGDSRIPPDMGTGPSGAERARLLEERIRELEEELRKLRDELEQMRRGS